MHSSCCGNLSTRVPQGTFPIEQLLNSLASKASSPSKLTLSLIQPSKVDLSKLKAKVHAFTSTFAENTIDVTVSNLYQKAQELAKLPDNFKWKMVSPKELNPGANLISLTEGTLATQKPLVRTEQKVGLIWVKAQNNKVQFLVEGCEVIGRGCFNIIVSAKFIELTKESTDTIEVNEVPVVLRLAMRIQSLAIGCLKARENMIHQLLTEESARLGHQYYTQPEVEVALGTSYQVRYKGDLSKYIPSTPDFLLKEYFIRLTQALSLMHELAITHQDIKLNNIFISGEVALLGDFGMSKKKFGLEEEYKIVKSEEFCSKHLNVSTPYIDFYKFLMSLFEIFSVSKESVNSISSLLYAVIKQSSFSALTKKNFIEQFDKKISPGKGLIESWLLRAMAAVLYESCILGCIISCGAMGKINLNDSPENLSPLSAVFKLRLIPSREQLKTVTHKQIVRAMQALPKLLDAQPDSDDILQRGVFTAKGLEWVIRNIPERSN